MAGAPIGPPRRPRDEVARTLLLAPDGCRAHPLDPPMLAARFPHRTATPAAMRRNQFPALPMLPGQSTLQHAPAGSCESATVGPESPPVKRICVINSDDSRPWGGGPERTYFLLCGGICGPYNTPSGTTGGCEHASNDVWPPSSVRTAGTGSVERMCVHGRVAEWQTLGT